MKIYAIIGSVDMQGSTQEHRAFTCTKNEAKKYITNCKKHFDHCELKFMPYEIEPSRLGIVGALNSLLFEICFNE